MNDQYMTKMAAAFLAELSEIEKQAFLGFLGKGLHSIGRAAGVGTAGKALKGNMAQRVFGSAAAGKRGFGGQIKHLYQQGAAGGKGMMGGLKSVGASPVGGMAAVGAIPVGAYALGNNR